MTTGAEWLDQARRLVDTVLSGPAQAPDTAEGAPAAHADTCRWCPLCQVAAVVRGERPDVTAALADVLTATASALRAFAEDAPAAGAAPAAAAPTAPSPAGDAPGAESEPAVQRIELA